jgi:hypothetical protein
VNAEAKGRGPTEGEGDDRFLFPFYIRLWSTRWRSWLRHCATSRKVAGSIPDGVIGIFYSLNPSRRTMALGSTQPLTEMSTCTSSWGGGGLRQPVRRDDLISGSLNLLEP